MGVTGCGAPKNVNHLFFECDFLFILSFDYLLQQ